MASSMTMPTISTRASMVTLLSVKSSAAIMPKVAITEAGMATAAMTRRAPAAHERQHHQAGEDAAQDQVQVDLVQRRVDVARLVADDLAASRRREAAAAHARSSALTPSITSTVLAPDCRRTSRVTVGTPFEPRQRALLLGAVLGAADVAHADRRAVDASRSTRSLKALASVSAAHGAQRLLARRAGDVAAGHVGVLARPGHRARR